MGLDVRIIGSIGFIAALLLVLYIDLVARGYKKK